jgi:hypothetical protein
LNYASKSDRNKSNPEKYAELNENWANNYLPLKYDDHACIERNEIVLFAQHLSLSFATLSRAKSRYEGFRKSDQRSPATCNCMNPGLIPTTTGLFREFNPIFTTVSAFLNKNVFKVAVSSGTILIVKSRLVKLSCVTYDVNKVLKLHVSRFNYNSAEEEGGNRLAYLIASDELQGVSGRYFSGRPGSKSIK